MDSFYHLTFEARNYYILMKPKNQYVIMHKFYHKHLCIMCFLHRYAVFNGHFFNYSHIYLNKFLIVCYNIDLTQPVTLRFTHALTRHTVTLVCQTSSQRYAGTFLNEPIYFFVCIAYAVKTASCCLGYF